MSKYLILAPTLLIVVGMVLSMAGSTLAGKSDGPLLCHMVFFSLKDNSAAETQKLVDACNKYLSKHEGEVFFGAGTLAKDLKREVNDQDFDVALHIVFQNRAAHDKYQVHERHEKFIAESKANWKKVRVFDSLVGK